MKLIDTYILRQFIMTAVFGLLAFTAIFVIIDLMENLDDFLDNNVPTDVIIQYYIVFTPEIIKLMTPVAVLLSSLFTTGKYSSNNELTAMKAGGVSLYRYMLPIVSVALFISLISVYFSGWVVPTADRLKYNIERKYLQKHLETLARSNIYLQDGPRRIISISFFDGYSNSGSRTSIQIFTDDNLLSIDKRFDAHQIIWDSTSHTWTLRNVTERRLILDKEQLRFYPELKFDSLYLTPKDIIKKIDKPAEMDYNELKNFIARQQQSGNDVARWQVDFYSRIAFPFASLIVVLFGIPFSFGKRRSGLAIQFGVSVAICFIYMAFMKISEVFGYNGDIHPMLTSWMANIIFFTGGMINILRVNK